MHYIHASSTRRPHVQGATQEFILESDTRGAEVVGGIRGGYEVRRHLQGRIGGWARGLAVRPRGSCGSVSES